VMRQRRQQVQFAAAGDKPKGLAPHSRHVWGCGQSVEPGRRHECRRGTHECVRHVVMAEWPVEGRATE
jgi:hypothetical protein